MNKECKKCGKEFTPEKGLISYCSLQCRNSRTWSDEDKEKKSNAYYAKYGKIEKKEIEVIVKAYSEKKEIKKRKNIMDEDYEKLSYERLRKRILIEQEFSCNRCDLSEWQGLPIPLELEHIDGNNKNNSRDNLEILCANCHGQTTTWRGRNKTYKRYKISDEELLSTLLKNGLNMRQSLVELGLSPKGGNYNRCHAILNEAGIPTIRA